MSANQTEFKFIDRNRQDAIVLIPGWAQDKRIFNGLNIRFNYLICDKTFPFTFEEALLCSLKKNNIRKFSLLGFSLGGFVAGEVASKHKGLIHKLILVSVRKKYKPEEIKFARDNIRKNKNLYLHRFYSACFYKEEDLSRFKRELMKDYCDEFSLDFLLNGLDYLEHKELNIDELREIGDISFIHGERDKIAPKNEILKIKSSLQQAKFLFIKDEGHIPNFSKISNLI